jgi:hypothetical protein
MHLSNGSPKDGEYCFVYYIGTGFLG